MDFKNIRVAWLWDITQICNPKNHPQNPENSIKYTLTSNRGVRHFAQNKVCPQLPKVGLTKIDQNSYQYLAVKFYNELPKELTPIKNHNIFKIWLAKYKQDEKILMKSQPYNTKLVTPPKIDLEKINTCMEKGQSDILKLLYNPSGQPTYLRTMSKSNHKMNITRNSKC